MINKKKKNKKFEKIHEFTATIGYREISAFKKINREIYTCVSILLAAACPVQAGQSWYGIQLYPDLFLCRIPFFFFFHKSGQLTVQMIGIPFLLPP